MSRHKPAELGGHHGGGGEVVYDHAVLTNSTAFELANLSGNRVCVRRVCDNRMRPWRWRRNL